MRRYGNGNVDLLVVPRSKEAGGAEHGADFSKWPISHQTTMMVMAGKTRCISQARQETIFNTTVVLVRPLT